MRHRQCIIFCSFFHILVFLTLRVCITSNMFPSTAALARTAAANRGVTVLHAVVESDVDFFILEEHGTADVWPQM